MDFHGSTNGREKFQFLTFTGEKSVHERKSVDRKRECAVGIHHTTDFHEAGNKKPFVGHLLIVIRVECLVRSHTLPHFPNKDF